MRKPALVVSAAVALGVGLGLAQFSSPKGPPPVLVPSVVKTYPHDPAAYTQGLQYLGSGRLLESTGVVGQSGVRLVRLSDGRTEKRVATPNAQAFGEGATQLGDTIYHITWQHGQAYAFDRNLREIGRFKYTGEGWGLTHDGKSLIMSDGSDKLFWRDPKTFAVKRELRVTDEGKPVEKLNELEWVGGAVYANIWLTDRIAKIDPRTGRVTAWIDVSALSRQAATAAAKAGRPLNFDAVPNGIAYVPERGTLLLGGKLWPTLFEVKVEGVK
ncbi:glutaminyl-peptide cyclotransferase [Deinococcus lacus]|uniref:Glutaminyl-peptide cyclotransferase n=1 Tax=Deinococcus lacus TaxID=392561 RepID=A0ABW1YAC4_9DEIO